MPSTPFPHLPFAGVEESHARLYGGSTPSEQTQANKMDRQGHANKLKGQLDRLNAWWAEQKEMRDRDGLPELDGVASWVKIDPSEQNAEFLRGLGFEIVSEEEEGFVLVAASQRTFVVSAQVLDKFVDLQRKRNGSPAKLYEIGQPETEDERIKRILPADLWERWRQIDDNQNLIVDLGVSCDVKPLSKFDLQREDETEEQFQHRTQKRETKRSGFLHEWEKVRLDRESMIQRWVTTHGGEIKQCYESSEVDFPDSFTVRVAINGQGFKDIVRNFKYLFQVENLDEIDQGFGNADIDSAILRMRVIPPDAEAPSICVIDSGIMEEHKLLRPAIRSEESRNFIPGESESDTADYVEPVGHGTPVAGAILYPDVDFTQDEVTLSGFIQNARILNASKMLPDGVQPALYVETIVKHYHRAYGTRIFNHSINASVPYRTPHMSTWAACMDRICYEHDVLLVQSAGNLNTANSSTHGILGHLQAGRSYPGYLHENSARIANPAQSYQALTVGSIGAVDYEGAGCKAIAGHLQSSPFSRSGPGIWNSIKPEVVAIGGDLIIQDADPIRVATHTAVSPLMIQSTLHGRPAVGRNSVGTSFAAPRVAALALELQKELPEESVLLYRALIANSARWPHWAEVSGNKYEVLSRIGYGIPDWERALHNDAHRVTLIASGQQICARQAKLFRIPVPLELRASALDFQVRVDITLSYSAMPRRTRKGARQYLSCWADWKCSGKNQTEEAFRGGLFKEEERGNEQTDYLPWMLRNDQHGVIAEARRNIGTLQKDWAIVHNHDLPDSFLIGVVGHPGWDTAELYPAKFALAVSFEAVRGQVDIYEPIRVALDSIRVSAARVRVDSVE